MYADDQLLALSGLQHLSFCERQWALIHVEQIWADNVDTLRGSFFHKRVDAIGYACANSVRSVRGVRLVSRELGLYGVADIVEYRDVDLPAIKPVEYKVGKPKVEDWDRIQLTAQAMCLEEMSGTVVREGDIFYGKTRRRETVILDDDLRSKVIALSAKMHDLFDRGITPQAIVTPRCKHCSLRNDCVIEVANKSAIGYLKRHEIY